MLASPEEEEIIYPYYPLATLILLIVHFNFSIAFPPSYFKERKIQILHKKDRIC